jgi:mRNA-degrading endonuclease RelE of RelBE toxin-antitoxin system
MFEIRFAEGALEDLEAVPRFQRGRLLDAIERQLSTAPAAASRNRKELAGLIPPWDQVRRVWQLRVGEYRVFYDVDGDANVVIVQAIRRKGRKTTKDIL